ncbi:MAG: hypothetical protein M1571_04215 [Firmicutes bacterium]|nr:hypothetical protein [Bacillota bacterium]
MSKTQISPEFQRQMAKIRRISPPFYNNDTLGNLPPLTRFLFIGLWCQADRKGRLQDRPRAIKKAILGYDDVTTGQVDGMLQELHNAGLITRYQAEDSSFIQVADFTYHQNPHVYSNRAGYQRYFDRQFND